MKREIEILTSLKLVWDLRLWMLKSTSTVRVLRAAVEGE
jgi:hypothetical protein